MLLRGLYKLAAKTLSSRVKGRIHKWIRRSQIGFVPNRCILNNVVLAQEAIVWAKESRQDLVVLLFDFEKTYDRLSWIFLEETLCKKGFAEEWIKWVRAMYVDATTEVVVNGSSTNPFKVKRSVRQGCPLAPYLYIFWLGMCWVKC